MRGGPFWVSMYHLPAIVIIQPYELWSVGWRETAISVMEAVSAQDATEAGRYIRPIRFLEKPAACAEEAADARAAMGPASGTNFERPPRLAASFNPLPSTSDPPTFAVE